MNETSKWANVTVRIVAGAVLINGLFLIISTLVEQLVRRGYHHSSIFAVEVSLITGLTLIYLSNLLYRRKQNAWVVTLAVYGLYIILNLGIYLRLPLAENHHNNVFELIRNYLVPIVVVAGLISARNYYRVKSDIRSFGVSLRITFIVLLVAFCYGIAGFELMSKSDFHHHVSFLEAAHRTIDQLGLTTKTQLIPYSRKARAFLDSLNAITIGALVYTIFSFFQPLKARFGSQAQNRHRAWELLGRYPDGSEDFFKLWPLDKSYYFNKTNEAGVAFRVHRGIALVVGDPFGVSDQFNQLIENFSEFCRINDWVPSFIHTEPKYNDLYQNNNFSLQKIGEEAVLDIDHYHENVKSNKYFRNIKNRFENNGYKTEMLLPPHDQSILRRLREISDDWLKIPGRTERGLMMGFFTESYMNQCAVMVLKDEENVIQAFMNQVPTFYKEEANYDLLRHTRSSPNNASDFLMMNFISHVSERGFKRINLGLAPLVGIDKKQTYYSLIDRALQFVYSNFDRFYSFSGLSRFKSKYEPNWQDRYIVYKGGIRGFTRTVNALNAAMKPHYPLHESKKGN